MHLVRDNPVAAHTPKDSPLLSSIIKFIVYIFTLDHDETGNINPAHSLQVQTRGYYRKDTCSKLPTTKTLVTAPKFAAVCVPAAASAKTRPPPQYDLIALGLPG